MSATSLDYLGVSETKLGCSFPSTLFHIHWYEVKARRDGDKNWGGLTEFVRKGFTWKWLKKLEPTYSEVICTEFTILNKKWVCFNIYRSSTQIQRTHNMTDPRKRNVWSFYCEGRFQCWRKSTKSRAWLARGVFCAFNLSNLIKLNLFHKNTQLLE